ncbi:MAG TPA: ABC transporter substrate-binding protein, partial [Blastocatellia bacterium]|nr:ABC transporter substrate-binding protein [Blastocatellia bacterium]
MNWKKRGLFLFLSIGLPAGLWIALGSTAAQTPSPEEMLTPAQVRGREIYRKGSDQIQARLGDDDLELPATTFPCANCHGLTGLGGREGGWQPAPIAWDFLTSPRSSSFSGKMRPAYDETTLKRAIVEGIDPGGGKLHPGMPRYRMSEDRINDLVAYLKVIGLAADHDPGITASTIKVGAALPLTGPLAPLGEDLRAMLSTVLAEQNARGGVFGRRIELAVEDSRGEPAGTAAATARLLETDRVFALVGSFAPTDSSATGELLKQAEVPLIGPVTISPPMTAAANPFIYYLLPDLAVQARVLVDFAVTGKFGESIAVFHSDHAFDRDAALGIRTQSKIRSIRVAAEMDWPAGKFSPAAAIERLEQSRPQALFFFAGPEDLKTLAGALERAGLRIPVLSATARTGREALKLPPDFTGRLYLAHPAGLPDREGEADDGADGYAAFEEVMMKSGPSSRHAAFRAVAYAAAKIFIETAKASGREL